MKQLMMIHRMEQIDNYPVPEGWTVRNWRPGEIGVWTELCQNGLCGPDDGTFATWRNCIVARENLVPERDIFFICRENDVPEATLTAYVRPNGHGDIHMVAAAPSIRGNNVGRVMLAVGMRKLDAEMTNRPRITCLTTDDWRIPAIVGYLKAGFQPVLYDEGMQERWQKICDELNLHGYEMLTQTGEPTGIVL